MTDLSLIISALLAFLMVAILFLQIVMVRGNRLSRDNTLQVVEKQVERTERTVREEIARNREEADRNARFAREEVSAALKAVNDSVIRSMSGMAETQQKQMDAFSERLAKLTESNQQKLDVLKTAVEEKLKTLQEDNAIRLEQMRVTVDEKLQGTLEKRLGESFRQVSERLEQVYKGLGEMQSLASGVGDLKRMLTNVKTRGTWGEVQLGAMLEQVLTPDQYEANVATKGGGERVEYAIKLPGKGDDGDPLWLPIDAKFPLEDYQRLLDAQEKADAEGAETAARQLETRIKQCAADISKKYLNPPKTTDFGILFLPTEGLFAEVLRRTGLPETIQRQHRVIVAGPTTLWSILNSLQMGFRTLAIEKRSSEVWKLLSAIKTEWSKYGAVLSKVHKKLGEASNTIEEAQVRTRVIGKKLRDVEEMPLEDALTILPADASAEEASDNDADEES
ncbi:MAG: DNA recombination protein RmuC [Syntrophales bacterium]|nr:DNA recombination protein RmuC [Syntrophales bacterium]